MTVVSEDVRSGPFFPNGVTTRFPFTFEVEDESEVLALLDGVELDHALYTVTLNDDGTGEAVFLTAPVGVSLVLESDPAFDQQITLQNQGPYFQRVIERLVDRLAARSLWLRDRIARALLFPVGEAGYTLPAAALRANRIFGFDGLGRPSLVDGVQAATGIIDFGIWEAGSDILDFGTWIGGFDDIEEYGVWQ